MLDTLKEEPDEEFEDALNDFEFFASSLPSLESLSFSVAHELDVDTHLKFPKDLFRWEFYPPTGLRHLILCGCYGGPFAPCVT